MRTFNKSIIAVSVAAAVLSAAPAFATNGYFSHGYSTKEKGLAGAGAAYSQDALANATNPAGMVFVGDRMDVGLQLFSPSPRSYTVSGAPSGFPGTFGLAPESVDSENDYFLIPSFGYNMALDAVSSVGISVYGNGGMNTKYEPTAANGNMGVFGAGTAGVNLAQLFTNATYARKLNDQHAVGASLIFAYQKFAASGLASFAGFSSDPNNLTGNRNSYSSGFGFKLGYQGEVATGVRVGASYQSKMSMSEFDEYKGLFAEGGDFDIPSTYTVGVSFDVPNSGKVVVDVQKINYTDVASVSNPFMNMLTGCTPGAPATGAGCLGGANGGGFGWEDMTIVKLGYQWNTGDTDWRVGISKGKQPIPDSEVMFNILAPAVIETHFTFGMTRKMDNNQEFNFAAMYAPGNDVSGPNPMEAPGQQTIKLEMSQLDFQAGWAWKY
jgi:long-chain fatty acid transport protein